MTPGEFVRSARTRHGVTQEQLAARAGTSQAAISRLERDLVSPSAATLAGLLRLLGEELVLTSMQVDFGHDRSLLRRNLAKSPEERLRDGVAFSNYVTRARGAARGAR